ncbi:hypothetical protein GCM10009630_67690 [Kribbella jejuensis]|uniref:Uncharacterized protein n=1 Tax=Kribbella jejuensis TaxID=236068 RepID=A0A542D9T2_9ACTN|nr:hypothetical protein [Kribbella jejuensis]TQI99842.1 hypothetical protein FB475_6830 [Kribbella jejuensis]
MRDESTVVEYGDTLTDDDAPRVEDRERRRRPYVVTAAAVAVAAVLIGIAFAARPTYRQADPEPTIGFRQPSYAVDGPAPSRYKLGSTVILLRGEIAVTSAQLDPNHLTVLTVRVEPDDVAIEPCLPNTIVRILSQDGGSVRIAAYRYGIAPDQNEGHQCANRGPAPTMLRLDLGAPLGNRTVYAGTTGEHVVLKGRDCLRPAGSFAARCR